MIAVNAAAQLVALGGILVVQTAYLVLVARILGVDDFGRFSFVFSITQILLIGGDLGLHNTALRKIAFRPDRSREILPLFLSLKVVVSFFLLVIVWAIALLVGENPETGICLALLGGGMFFHSVGLSINIAFQAHGRLYLASLNSFLLSLIQFGLGVAGLMLGGRLVWLGGAYLGAALISLLINWQVFRLKIHGIRLVLPVQWKEFFVESLPVGLGTFFENAALRISFTLLTYLVGAHETGMFSSAARVTGALRNLPIGIFSAFLPVMASHQGDSARVHQLFRKSFKIMLVISVPLSVALYVSSDLLVSFLYGPSYLPAGALLRVLVWSLIPIFLGMAFSHVMLSQGRLLRGYPLITGGALAFNILVNWILIPLYGAAGAAVTTLLTEIFLAILYFLGVRRFLGNGS